MSKLQKLLQCLSAWSGSVVLLGSAVTRAEVLIVTTPQDGGPGSLRQAIRDADHDDEIRFDPSLDGRPILLTRGELVVDRRIIITGRGPQNTIVDARGRSRVFRLECCFNTVMISSMTVRNGESSWTGGCISNEQYVVLSLNNLVITGCAGEYGGGVYNGGSLTLSNSTLSGNSARWGGGLYNSSQLWMFNSTVHANSASSGGGGLFNDGTSWLSNLTIYGNTAADGGGGLFNWNGRTSLSSTTVSGNSAFRGGGLDAVQGAVLLKNTIVAMQHSGGDCSSVANEVRSLGHSLDSDGSCNLNQSTDLPGADPMLEPLADNGGPTPTCGLRAGSPAMEAGGDDCEPTDQRGEPRPRDGDRDGTAWCDLGAVEEWRATISIPGDDEEPIAGD